MNNIVFVVELPLTETNNVVTYNVSKAEDLTVRDVSTKLREAVETIFPGIECVQVYCRQNPDWHEIVRRKQAAAKYAAEQRPGFFKRIFGGGK